MHRAFLEAVGFFLILVGVLGRFQGDHGFENFFTLAVLAGLIVFYIARFK